MFLTHITLYPWIGWLNWRWFWLVLKKSLVWISARAVTAVSLGIPHSPQANAGHYLKFDHAYLIPHTSKFITDYQRITGCYILWVATFNTNINITLYQHCKHLLTSSLTPVTQVAHKSSPECYCRQTKYPSQ